MLVSHCWPGQSLFDQIPSSHLVPAPERAIVTDGQQNPAIFAQRSLTNRRRAFGMSELGMLGLKREREGGG